MPEWIGVVTIRSAQSQDKNDKRRLGGCWPASRAARRTAVTAIAVVAGAYVRRVFGDVACAMRSPRPFGAGGPPGRAPQCAPTPDAPL